MGKIDRLKDRAGWVGAKVHVEGSDGMFGTALTVTLEAGPNTRFRNGCRYVGFIHYEPLPTGVADAFAEAAAFLDTWGVVPVTTVAL